MRFHIAVFRNIWIYYLLIPICARSKWWRAVRVENGRCISLLRSYIWTQYWLIEYYDEKKTWRKKEYYQFENELKFNVIIKLLAPDLNLSVTRTEHCTLAPQSFVSPLLFQSEIQYAPYSCLQCCFHSINHPHLQYTSRGSQQQHHSYVPHRIKDSVWIERSWTSVDYIHLSDTNFPILWFVCVIWVCPDSFICAFSLSV